MALDLNDKTANSNTLTNHGATEYTSDFPFVASTEAVALASASSQYLDAADSASLSITGNITLELWVKLDSSPGSGVIYTLISKLLATGNQRSYEFYYHNDGGTLKLGFITSDDGSGADVLTVNNTLATDTWIHLAIVWTASTATAEFFKNGASIGSSAGAKTSLFNSTALLNIGRSEGVGNYFNGKIDDVRIWNGLRTETQINDNKSVELAGNESGLAAYWPFESLVTSTIIGGSSLLNFL